MKIQTQIGRVLIISFIESPGVIRHTAGSDKQLITFGELTSPCESPRVAASPFLSTAVQTQQYVIVYAWAFSLANYLWMMLCNAWPLDRTSGGAERPPTLAYP